MSMEQGFWRLWKKWKTKCPSMDAITTFIRRWMLLQPPAEYGHEQLRRSPRWLWKIRNVHCAQVLIAVYWSVHHLPPSCQQVSHNSSVRVPTWHPQNIFPSVSLLQSLCDTREIQSVRWMRHIKEEMECVLFSCVFLLVSLAWPLLAEDDENDPS